MSLSIADAADQLSLTPHTLRYYERDGLMLREIPRDAGGRRRYEDEDLEWIRLVVCLRATGMPIELVRRYAELVRIGEVTELDRLELLRTHRVDVLDQLARTTKHLESVERKIALYESRLTSSALEVVD